MKRASTAACCRCSASCSSAASRRWIIVYYQEVPRPVRAAVGGGAGAREGRLQCGGLIDADRRDRLDFGRAGSARCGARGGGNAVACCRVVGRCRPDRRGPLPPPVVRVGDVRFLLACARLCARRMRKKLQPCAWRHVAKVGPTDPASCMRCYISVLRLNRPQSAILFGFNWGLKLSAGPLSLLCSDFSVGCSAQGQASLRVARRASAVRLGALGDRGGRSRGTAQTPVRGSK